ncbi:MAM domain-containing glycosylphosphatidylinositol anchor protein 2-like [Ruditapes philippinarum]|uniref:MAM domain-containing glycosylphosphatidylinositol anchor protein 2-like n=1 Tax=Ruditapes philippinarum TaxID=129788 RepID=UPI00295C0CBC|nr:MAM domain-containing glycosylphosphatidylinositol anchor protein 2-like [Ruditapes philippinarum]
MFGTGIGSLNVYMKSDTEMPLFSQSNSSDNNKWIKAVVSKDSPTDYQIIFDGTVGNNVKGDIAIDDITLTTGFCSPACTFDDGLCNWRQDQSDGFDWTRETGQTNTPLTGPPSDHNTENNGYYIYVETSYPREYGDKARLISPVQGSGLHCWTFWYSMFGRHINKLSVYIKTKFCTEILIFSKENGTKIADWMKADISLQTFSEYEIIIEGIRGNGPEGDIAVDDITMTNDTCKTGTK